MRRRNFVQGLLSIPAISIAKAKENSIDSNSILISFPNAEILELLLKEKVLTTNCGVCKFVFRIHEYDVYSIRSESGIAINVSIREKSLIIRSIGCNPIDLTIKNKITLVVLEEDLSYGDFNK